jgi:hypothetical protein
LTGPNKKNAIFLAGTGIFDLYDRIFAQLSYETSIYSSKGTNLIMMQSSDLAKGQIYGHALR